MEPLKPRKPARRTQSDPPAPSLSEDLHTRISTRALGIHEQRIGQGALDDWLQAKRDILKEKRAKPKRLYTWLESERKPGHSIFHVWNEKRGRRKLW